MSSNNTKKTSTVSDATGKSKLVLLIVPPILVATMFVSFQILVKSLGFHTGYLISFVIYWSAWGIIFPILALGGMRELANLFSQRGFRSYAKPTP